MSHCCSHIRLSSDIGILELTIRVQINANVFSMLFEEFWEEIKRIFAIICVKKEGKEVASTIVCNIYYTIYILLREVTTLYDLHVFINMFGRNRNVQEKYAALRLSNSL